uniref:succinate dehydrogenase n=1 Tax=Pharyngomonas kirbyi TaxID=63601 RepID=A0A1W6R286_9EUKA|nr:succinate:cytochrome c oxidoreductase subunit 2 [Pharyngomonas kirbyi]ARO48014.1 succinate:cytochrome c oxidoreductase subunit 2 [Pharyngomonas kirbyi]
MKVKYNFKNEIKNYTKFWRNTPELLPTYTSISINRFNIKNFKSKTYIEKYFVTSEQSNAMLLDVLFYLQQYTPSLSFRRSCREGICGSCGMNVNGTNVLACLFSLKKNIVPNKFLKKDVVKYNHLMINPLPHMPVVKDLVVSLDHFYKQYNSISPFRKKAESDINQTSNQLNMTKKKDRALIDGVYECILCACCSTSCPSYWWNSQSYLGPAVLLQAFRWIMDPNDHYTLERLRYLDDGDKLHKCHNIMNCSLTCPKGLKPAESISQIKNMTKTVNIKTLNFRNSNLIN